MTVPQPALVDERQLYSVAAVTRGLADWVARLPEIWIEAEIAELSDRGRGLVFLTLRDLDGSASVSAQIERARFRRLSPAPEQGHRIVARARPVVFPKRGSLSLAIVELEHSGLGQLLAEIERRRGRLAADGLFALERKRRLPFIPSVVGLITGRDAAARADVVENATRRFPRVRFSVIECAVQGPHASADIRRALATHDADETVDVIVIARGGGSVEDLLPFSDEALCRAIAASATPVVSAIGHEQDAPLCDLVADARASTPTHAARLIVPDARELAADLASLRGRLSTSVDQRLGSAARLLVPLARDLRRNATQRLGREREGLARLRGRPVLARPTGFLQHRRASLAPSRSRLGVAVTRRLAAERAGLAAIVRPLAEAPERRIERERLVVGHAHRRLRALGPASTLERGYAIVLDADGHTLADAHATIAGAMIDVRLARGTLAARVTEVRR